MIIGSVFNRLTVIAFSSRNSRGYMRYICQCSCGKIVNTPTRSKLITGHTKSCGCLKNETMSKNMSKYKNKGRRIEYGCWRNMKERCTNLEHPSFPRYGGRGIKVCDRWLKSFDNFYEDMGEKPFKEANLDRVDNNGDYEPDNCRWTTPFENTMNRECSNNDNRNIYTRSTGYYAQVERTLNKKTYKRFSYVVNTIQEAKSIRDLWLKEFDENKEIWFYNTVNNLYRKG